MPMQKRTWTISGLSVELEIDRRTLAKRLQGLPPAEIKRIGDRTERRWYLQDVVEHLQDAPKGKRRGGRPRIDGEMIARFNRIIAEDLFPDVIASPYFERVMLAGGVEDYGLSESQSRNMFGLAVLGLSYALAETLGDPDIKIGYHKHTIELIKDIGDESKAAAITQ